MGMVDGGDDVGKYKWLLVVMMWRRHDMASLQFRMVMNKFVIGDVVNNIVYCLEW